MNKLNHVIFLGKKRWCLQNRKHCIKHVFLETKITEFGHTDNKISLYRNSCFPRITDKQAFTVPSVQSPSSIKAMYSSLSDRCNGRVKKLLLYITLFEQKFWGKIVSIFIGPYVVDTCLLIISLQTKSFELKLYKFYLS